VNGFRVDDYAIHVKYYGLCHLSIKIIELSIKIKEIGKDFRIEGH
jgi:hypothetical protein